MSKSTIRKRIALTATTALFAGMLTVTSVPVASATHPNAGGTTFNAALGTVDASMGVSVVASNGTAAAMPTDVGGTSATQKGLLAKDTSSGTAQTATILAGGQVAFYAKVTTSSAFTATGGSFSSAGNYSNTAYASSVYNSNNTQVVIPFTALQANATTTAVGTLWTAPTTVGTYTVSLYTSYYTNGAIKEIASATTDTLPETLSGNLTVTVAAASAGGAYSATNSLCQAVKNTVTYTAATSSNVDDTGTNTNGSDWSVDVFLRDAYGASLPTTGNLVATATNGALLAFGTAGTTPVAGSASTISTTGAGNNSTIRVSQATAGAPITTTVTISGNGPAVCTKIAVQDLGASAGNAFWFADGTARAGTFYVVATDSVGNRVPTPSTLGTFSADGATLGTTVTAVTFDAASLATTTSSSSALSATVGRHSCAATAGTQKGVKIKFTLANGTVVTSAPFDLGCADDPATVSASFDKAKYTSGDVATLTVSFKDTKGNASNNISSLGASTIAVPGMTLVSTTGAADAVAKAGGKVTYTYTVGQTAGKYAAVVDFTGASSTFAQYATVQNPSYEISTGGDTTSNADVLKSIVALIASINKQIQALQKLILKR